MGPTSTSLRVPSRRSSSVPALPRIRVGSVLSYRRRLWPNGRFRTLRQFSPFLDRAGLVLIFGSDEIPLPKVYDLAHDDSDDWWNWKDHLQILRRAYLGRVIAGKATLVSMELLPCFLSLYHAEGGCGSYDEEHYYGRLSEGARRICQFLDREGPQPADRLRKALGYPPVAGTRRFHQELLGLQRKFKVVTTGLVGKGWATRVVGLFEDWVPGKVERAAWMSPARAREILLERILRVAGAAPERILLRMLGWPPEALRAASEALLQRRQAWWMGGPPPRREPWLAGRGFLDTQTPV